MAAKGPARSIDLLLTILGALVALGVAVFVNSGALATVVSLSLVFVLPGYALSAALFPPRAIGRDLRLVLTVVLSLAALALGGLVLHLVTALNRGTFVGLLAVVTLLAAAVALKGRQRMRADPRRRRPRPPIVVALALAATIGLAAVAIAIASAGAHHQIDESHFSALWAVPQGGRRMPPNEPPVLVGIGNQEGKAVDYRLTVHQAGREIGTWKVRLDDGQEWEITLPADALSDTGTLVASLHRFRQTYRRVSIKLDTAPSPTANG
jgi:hypothetical protein